MLGVEDIEFDLLCVNVKIKEVDFWWCLFLILMWFGNFGRCGWVRWIGMWWFGVWLLMCWCCLFWLLWLWSWRWVFCRLGVGMWNRGCFLGYGLMGMFCLSLLGVCYWLILLLFNDVYGFMCWIGDMSGMCLLLCWWLCMVWLLWCVMLLILLKLVLWFWICGIEWINWFVFDGKWILFVCNCVDVFWFIMCILGLWCRLIGSMYDWYESYYWILDVGCWLMDWLGW